MRANWLNLRHVAIIGNRIDFVTGSCFKNDVESQNLVGRAKATEAAQVHAVEVTLWDGDLSTWLQETSPNEEVSRDGDDGENSIAGDLNATLVTFSPSNRSWPEQPPPQERSRL